jgi:hypothetical protein
MLYFAPDGAAKIASLSKAEAASLKDAKRPRGFRIDAEYA